MDIGKANIYIMELGKDELYEDEAALRMALALQGEGTGADRATRGQSQPEI